MNKIIHIILSQSMFSQMVEEEQRKNQELNKKTKQQGMKSQQKFKTLNQKLMVYEVITSRQKILTELSPEAKKISKRLLGVNVNAVSEDANSNLRAYSYMLLLAMTQPNTNLQTSTQIHQKLQKLKQNTPKITNYPTCQKFKQNQMLQFFTAMQQKIQELLNCKLGIAEIIKFYNCYLDIITFFLRSLLAYSKMEESSNWNCKLRTSAIFSILSDYLDLQCLPNQNVYIFPDVKFFIASIDEKQFVFGKCYDNVQELRKNQTQIRQSTMEHITNTNQKYSNMRISNIVVDVSMSQCMFPQKLADLQAPFSSKAPTPQFGENQYQGFQQLLAYNSEEQQMRQNSKNQMNQKETKPESLHNLPFCNDDDEIIKNTIKLHRESVFTRKTFNDEVMTPTANNKNNIGSAFYLHQFDFYHRINKQCDSNDKFSSQRVLLKGSSMVDQGKNFLNQVGELKKQIQNQMFDKIKEKRRFKQTDLHESIEANALKHDFQRKSRNPSPQSQIAKSEGIYDQKSCHSGFSKKSSNKMALTSDVYHLSIQTKQPPKPNPNTENSRSTSKSKITSNIRVAPSQNSPSLRHHISSNITINTSSKPQLPKLQKIYRKNSGFRTSQVPQPSSQNGYNQNQNQNHIHIHIHNQNNLIGQRNGAVGFGVGSPKNKKSQNQFHYNISDKNLRSAFQSAIPKIIQQLQQKNPQKTLTSSVRTQIKNFKQVLNFKQTQESTKSPPSSYKPQKSFTAFSAFTAFSPFTAFTASAAQSINMNKNKHAQLESNVQMGFKIRKKKSNDGFQKVCGEFVKEENVGNQEFKRYVHIPSFLRNKEKVKTQNNVQRAEKSVKRQHSRSLKMGGNLAKSIPTISNPSSPKSTLAYSIPDGKKMHLNIKSNPSLNLNSNVTVNTSKNDLETPTFGTPQQSKNKNKSVKHKK